MVLATLQSQSQRLLRSSLLAADLTAEMETMAQRHVSMYDLFHLPLGKIVQKLNQDSSEVEVDLPRAVTQGCRTNE